MNEEIDKISIEFLTRLARSNEVADPELNKQARLLDLEWALRAVMDTLGRSNAA